MSRTAQESSEITSIPSSTTTAEEEDDEEEEDDDEEIEPKLKYVRLLNDFNQILTDENNGKTVSTNQNHLLISSSATCIAVHAKFLCVGTNWGLVHVLDHQGNCVQDSDSTPSHTLAVNHISIDENGEFIGSCSDDGLVIIHELFADPTMTAPNRTQHLPLGRQVKFLALDPNYARKGGGSGRSRPTPHHSSRRFITGDSCGLTLYERNLFGNLKATVLASAETGGPVRALNWGADRFVAWANPRGCRVYDMTVKCSLGLIEWAEWGGEKTTTTANETNTVFRCNLQWANPRTLLIGWADTVRVCVVRRSNSYTKTTINQRISNVTASDYVIDLVATFQTDFYICGIAPLDQQLVLLGCAKHPKNNQMVAGGGSRPRLYIVDYLANDYTDIATDNLTLRGYEQCQLVDYHLAVLPDENRLFIVAPKDIVVASTYDLNDRITWLVRHKRFSQAIDILAATDSATMRRQKHSLQSVGILYLNNLLARKKYDAAGKLCMKIFEKNPTLWEEHIYKFATVHQLRSVSSYIPQTVDTCRLKAHIYEMVLFEYLKLDATGFLQRVRDWSPELYNVSVVINATLEHLVVLKSLSSGFPSEKHVYLEALAILYSFQRRYDKSISIYLELNNVDVFQLIQKHQLYGVLDGSKSNGSGFGAGGAMLVDLMELDWRRTLVLLMDSGNPLSVNVVCDRLKGNRLHLFRYLDECDRRGKLSSTDSGYHNDLVDLYAIFARDKLLQFLRKSNHYCIEQALEVCRRDKLYPEMVYLLGRMGDTKIALQLIMSQLKDIQQAISFCREHNDPDLWLDLIRCSLETGNYITYLLQTIGAYINPTVLVEWIADDTIIPGLKQSLVKMLQQYRLEVTIQECNRNLLVADFFSLQRKLVKCRKRGVLVSPGWTECGACRRAIFPTPIVLKEETSAPYEQCTIFHCKHVFHKECLPEPMHFCTICHEQQ